MTGNVGLVIKIVGAVFVLSVLGIIGLAAFERSIPDVLQNVAVGSMALLGGLLVPTRAEKV